MPFTKERIDEIIDGLRGTCIPLSDFLEPDEEGGEDDKELCEAIDADIFLCPVCNWWCERSEGHESDMGEDVCDDCARDGHSTEKDDDDE